MGTRVGYGDQMKLLLALASIFFLAGCGSSHGDDQQATQEPQTAPYLPPVVIEPEEVHELVICFPGTVNG